MNAGKRGLVGTRTLITLALAGGAFIGVGMAMARHDEQKGVRPISAWDIVEKLDGKETKVSVVEVMLEPGQAGQPHRHTGPVIGYVLEGEYEWAIRDRPARKLKAGDTFYEPAMCLHRVSRNPGRTVTRLLVVMLHPRDAEELVIPERTKEAHP
jgi:quercetin dioxygenase-like cupin family protein